jgi:predicted transposase YbfD/YdcC
MPAGEMAKQFPTWKGLNTLGVAIGYRCDSKGNESLEYRYYISSAALTEEQFATAVRGHWGIESVPQAHKKICSIRMCVSYVA